MTNEQRFDLEFENQTDDREKWAKLVMEIAPVLIRTLPDDFGLEYYWEQKYGPRPPQTGRTDNRGRDTKDARHNRRP